MSIRSKVLEDLIELTPSKSLRLHFYSHLCSFSPIDSEHSFNSSQESGKPEYIKELNLR